MEQVIETEKNIGGYAAGYHNIEKLCFLFFVKTKLRRNTDIGNFNSKQVNLMK